MSKKVFFLGAGFSKALDSSYPLSEKLCDFIPGDFAKGSISTHHYKEVPNPVKKDIESLLTYLATGFPWKSDVQRYADQALYTDVVRIISKRFDELAKGNASTPDNEITTLFREKLKGISEKQNCNFITLNYDLLLESILGDVCREAAGWPVPFTHFYKYPVSRIENRAPDLNGAYILEGTDFPTKLPVILKLHGSASWYWSGINASDPIYCKSMKETEPSSNIDAGLVPYIIPPVMDKNGFYSHVAFKFLWREAKKLLEDADEIYVIGFSFPQTDLSVRYLFQSALRNSSAKIYVVNRDKRKKIKVNYNLVFGPKNKNVSYKFCEDDNALKKFLESGVVNG